MGGYIINTTRYFSNVVIYILPILLIAYSSTMWFLERKNKENLNIKIKRVYYSIILLLGVIILNTTNLSWICKEGLFGISKEGWSIIIFLIILLIIAIIIETCIISGYVFKEFGIFSARLVKEDTKEVIVNLDTTVGMLERNIKASNTCNLYIKKFLKKEDVHQDISDNKFDFIYNFKLVLLKYYRESQMDVTLEVELYKDEDIIDIVNKYKGIYNLNKSERNDIEENLQGIGSISISKENFNVMFVTSESPICKDKRILTAIKTNDLITRYDEYIIENLLRSYENEFIITGYSLIEASV